ncbi:uncharacterized protein [Callorhinus ursinus]|uniref:uncharacterized protein n=1 Tax=Callorhinus ursinus TaxID=34884 RepID=UPI003CD023E7
MDTFSRPANERAAEGAVAVGTGRLEQVHLGRAGAWRAVLTSGEAWELAQARRQVTLHREPRRGEASVPPRQPPPLWVAGHLRSTSRACAVRSLPSTPPPPPPGSAGAGCRATVWSQTLDSGVPSRPGMGEGRGGVPAETPDSQEGLGVAENVSTALQGPQNSPALGGLFSSPVLGLGAHYGPFGPSMAIARQIPPLDIPWGGLPVASKWLTCLFPAQTKTVSTAWWNCPQNLPIHETGLAHH